MTNKISSRKLAEEYATKTTIEPLKDKKVVVIDDTELQAFLAGWAAAIKHVDELVKSEIESTAPYTRKYALEHGTREADFILQGFELLERKIETLKNEQD